MDSALLEEISQDREKDVVVDGQRVHLTSLDRPIWPEPGYLKRDLIAYLVRVSDGLLPTLRDRPLSMVRYPDGVEGQRIFQRHWSKGLPEFVETVRVYSESNRGTVQYMMANNLATLVWLGQMSVIELHPWHSRVVVGKDAPGAGTDFDDSEGFDESVLNYPDYMVCDLDPNVEDRPFERAREVALRLHEILSERKLESFVKTSGKRGIHVYVPLARRYDFDKVRQFAEDIGRILESDMPKLVTLEPSLEKRPKGVFFDYGINSQAKTLACPLSPRGDPRGLVSFPLRWEQLRSAKPQDFTLRSAPRLLAEKGDPWQPLLSLCQDLPKAYAA